MTLKKLAETEKKHFKVGQKSTNQGDAHRFFFYYPGMVQHELVSRVKWLIRYTTGPF